ncbi:glutamic-type intramembrane protease PrsW [Oceanobacillus senegalensis]|uniref:glutamic-type intramembrane protease PrsW n=1 Tax=Oceanobacillus senegalensis TaxID=1936063 RepID=UPI000A3117E4|nr:glutamic-type intramembrane protease PrsW [Oceanobacillus senegalensis]
MIAVLSAGLAPAFALMSYIYLKDRVTEPLSLIIRSFILGALLVFPIMFIQYALASEEITVNRFIEAFIFVALLEEFIKWFIFMFSIYHHSEFDDHYDGIVYAVSISLGFASLENILYLLTNGLEYAFLRAFFPVSSHALFGVIMGYYFGRAKMTSHHTNSNRLFALLIPFLLHGLYNYILAIVANNWIYYLFPFMIFLWYFALHRMKAAKHSSRI